LKLHRHHNNGGVPQGSNKTSLEYGMSIAGEFTRGKVGNNSDVTLQAPLPHLLFLRQAPLEC
jgi:hypothetical protein